MDLRIPPSPGDFHPGYAPYLARVTDPLHRLRAQGEEVARGAAGLDPALETHRYAPEKWSVREVLAHVVDVERVMAYRLLRAARGDTTPLPSFDENAWVAASGAHARPLGLHVADFQAARGNTLSLVDALREEEVERRVEASGHPVTVRALVWILAGHADHHLALLRERYGVPFPGPSPQIGE